MARIACLLCVLLQDLVSAARVTGPGPIVQTGGAQFIESYGVPKLEVLNTSNDTEAAAFLSEWSDAQHFGLFVQLVPDNRAFFPRRAGLVGISRGTKVLLFNLKPHMRKAPRPLPKHLKSFLEKDGRTFLGLGVTSPVAHLAFEWDTMVRCIDYRVRSWRQMKVDGGLFALANLYFGTHWTRKPSVRTLKGQAVYTYLQWAVAEYFMTFHGQPQDDWVLTQAELFAYGPRHVRVEKPEHEWDEAREQWVKMKGERSEDRTQKSKEIQWYWNPRNMSLQDRDERVVSK